MKSGSIVVCPKKGWEFPNLKELWAFRDLFLLLVERDVKLKYKQTALGVAWVILQPLATALLFTLLFSRFAKIDVPHSSYLLFAYSGMVAWLLFSQVIQRASSSLLVDARLISKVYFPRLILPLASSAAVFFDFLIALSVMGVLLCFSEVSFSLNLLCILPCFFVEVMFAVGLSSALAAWNVHYRDFVHVIPFTLQLWMYATPLFYPSTLVPEAWRSLFALNPLVGIVEGFRFALLGQGEFPSLHFSLAVGVALITFVCGLFSFHRLEPTFADVI